MVKEAFYAVRKGRSPGIFATWAECEQQVKAFSGAEYKKFQTRQEAMHYIDHQRGLVKKNAEHAQSSRSIGLAMSVNIEPMKVDPNAVSVYCDGSCLGNGKRNPVAGVGVFFGPGDERNVAEPLEGPVQTNQRAELTAAIRVFQKVKPDADLIIHTDSRYVIKIMTEWLSSWKKKSWFIQKDFSHPDAKMNLDLILELDSLLQAHRGKVQWIHVPAHVGIPGNEAADALARRGSELNMLRQQMSS